MHEFSISSEIVRTVLDTAGKKNGKRVLSIQLVLGELTLLNKEQVLFWIRELFKGSIAEGAKIKLRTVKARISCEGCGYHGEPSSGEEDFVRHFTQHSCPQCGSFQIRVEKGRECLLRKIQMLR